MKNQRSRSSAERKARRDMRGGKWHVPGEEAGGKVVFGCVAATLIGALILLTIANAVEFGSSGMSL